MTTYYLPEEAIRLIGRLLHKNPAGSAAEAAALYAVILAISRWRAGRGAWLETLIFSLLLTGGAIFVAACIYILKTNPGYRFL